MFQTFELTLRFIYIETFVSAYNNGIAEIRLDRRSTSNVATNRIQMFPFYLYRHGVIMEP